MQDILRVRRFMADGQAYRMNIFRIDNRKPLRPPDGALPHAVIFDGAGGFLKWRDYWRNCHWIVVIDRTEPMAREAAGVLNRDYIENRIDGKTLDGIPAAPVGIELLSYSVPLR